MTAEIISVGTELLSLIHILRFDDSILYEGSAAFGWFALRWLYDNAGIAF